MRIRDVGSSRLVLALQLADRLALRVASFPLPIGLAAIYRTSCSRWAIEEMVLEKHQLVLGLEAWAVT
jgi:hypothetical protein